MPDARLEQFAFDLHQEVLAKAGLGVTEADEGSFPLREELFTEVILEMLAEHSEVDGWDICGYEAKSIGSIPAAKLNAWALSGDGATLDLFISLYYGTGQVEELGKPEMRRQFELALGFLRRALSGFHSRMEVASDAFHAAQSIYEARDTLATVRLFLITDASARTLDLDQETLPGVDIRYVAWDLEKLSRLRVGERAVIELDFEGVYGGGIPCLETSNGASEYRTFLAFLPGPLLARIYGEYGQRLLERNVRAFLQAKGKVNKGLRNTLKETPDRFLAYNNGLCCTAAEVRLAHGRDYGTTLLWAKDFQIVNGGQTTASIYHAVKKEKLDVSKVSVQMKLTVLRDPDKTAEIVPLISRYANSQNKVSGADFSANGKFHRDMEELSRTVWAPASSGMERGSHWYYERARGSYLDDKARQGTPAKQERWAKENPIQQKFTKTDLAKYEHAWLGLPHLACRGAEKNFEEFAKRLEEDGEPVVDRKFFEQVVARMILWRSTERLFDTLGTVGYRANSVAYAVAWLAERSDRRIDLDGIWREQRLTREISAALGPLCAKAHQFLMTRTGNIGEQSKSVETWAEFRDEEFEIGKDWRKGLTDAPTVVYNPRRLNPHASAARAVVAQVSADAWFALASWAKERGFLKAWERGLAFSLGRLAARRLEPTDKQVVQGARIWSRAQELGFQMQT